MSEFYPETITNLPEADIPFDGVRGWLSQSENHQIVFFEIEAIGDVAEHKHGTQWGTVFEGEMKLTIDNVTKTYRKGDSYFVQANTLHSATFIKKTWLMDFFADKNRYFPKKTS
ncbi:MAG: cupin domain-containing protein [Bacteroidales bacterium]|nr:cupin domain-containing protein [Bacteroidales bacterium]